MRGLLILFGLFSFLAYFWGTKYDFILFIIFIAAFFVVEAVIDRDDEPPDDKKR
ncbi:hypothetical protein [Priestia megaterium]|uniref:hypothetical protein n=1 Tax=Priestia megaterium TaxID=1404 RepID=UPI002E1E3DC7|nr:hypothetical protein [Priestia megaterium]